MARGPAPGASKPTTTGTRPSRPRATTTKSRPAAEEEEEDEIQDARGKDDDDDDDDDDDGAPTSTADLAAVLKAFAQSRDKKSKKTLKTQQTKLDAIFSNSEAQADKVIKESDVKCEKYVNSLNLENEGVSGPSTNFFSPLFKTIEEDQIHLEESLQNLSLAYSSTSNSFHQEALESVDHRQRLAKKAHKKFKNLVNDQASEQIEMAGLYSESGTLIIKHAKAMAIA